MLERCINFYAFEDKNQTSKYTNNYIFLLTLVYRNAGGSFTSFMISLYLFMQQWSVYEFDTYLYIFVYIFVNQTKSLTQQDSSEGSHQDENCRGKFYDYPNFASLLLHQGLSDPKPSKTFRAKVSFGFYCSDFNPATLKQIRDCNGVKDSFRNPCQRMVRMILSFSMTRMSCQILDFQIGFLVQPVKHT